MDPLAHTLVGATLAETGLKQKTAWATVTMMIAANLPDIDGLCLIGGHDAGLAGRRGITHGVLAWVVLPLMLATLMHALAKRSARRKAAGPPRVKAQNTQEGPPVSFAWLLMLSAIGVWSHPLLDWMNSYGVRLLMPFSPTWFYGDALFIIDPILWLFGGAAVVFAYGRTKVSAALWIVLLLVATAIVIVPSLTPPTSKMFWCLGAGLVVYLRIRGKPPSSLITARLCVFVLVMYIGTMLVGTANARTRAAAWLAQHNLAASQIVVVPLAARPFAREVIARVGQTYHVLSVPVFGGGPPQAVAPPLPVGEKTPAVEAALAAPQAQGAVKWLRLAAYEEKATSEGVLVTISDVRYSRIKNSRIGRTQVWLDHNLKVLAVQH